MEGSNAVSPLTQAEAKTPPPAVQAVSVSLTQNTHPVEKLAEIVADSGVAVPAVPSEAIAVAAYYLAERRGFEPGHEVEDWLLAEASLTDESRLAPQK